ncbi:hypothetical protein K8R04_03985 [Candidatus Uhrbacteria bacterium]|nr:hypothetical protein [Candidatus Uhrbacteria bacterium]
MLKNSLSFLLALTCLTVIGCGGSSVDMRSLVERLDRAEARATAAEEENARLARDRDDLMAGRPIEDDAETSGGDTATVTATAPVVGSIGAPFMSPVGSTGVMPGVVPSIDGVDSGLMFASGVLTYSQAYLEGTQPTDMLPINTVLVMNSSGYDVELEIAGRIVHVSEGGAYPDATVRSGGYAAAPVFRSGTSGSPMRFVIDASRLPGRADTSRSHPYRYRCFQTSGGMVPSDPTPWRNGVLRFGGSTTYGPTINVTPGGC